MQEPALFLISDADQPRDQLAAELRPILDCWQPLDQRPEVKALPVEQLLAEPSWLDRGGVAWLWLGASDRETLYELLEVVAERDTPALLTRADETEPLGSLQQEGVIVCPPETGPTVACAMLQTAFAQAYTIQSLHTELRLLNTQRGGLRDQMGKLDEELRLAARLQQQFLPQTLPRIGDVSLHALWRPASYVSGDIYDVARLDEHHIGFFLADAVGHGVPAALMTMYIKRSLHTKEIDPGTEAGYRLLEPSETLSRLNRDMLQTQNGQVHFATACYGILDCRDHTLRLARAGHPYPLLLHAGGAAETLEPEGGLLGVFEEEDFEQVTRTLEPGDRLLLYSDGFELAFPQVNEKGQTAVANEQYLAELRALGQGALDEALHNLMEKVDSQIGSLNQQDDLTVLCLAVREAVEKSARPSKPVAQSTALSVPS